MRLTHPGFRFRILATDISTRCWRRPRWASTRATWSARCRRLLKRKYFMRSRDPGSNRVRVVPELRRLIEFRRLNFMDADYGIAEKADAIFCRNVIIYFDRPTQEKVLQKLSSHLAPRGYMFVGHCRDAARYGSAPDAGGSGALQERSMPQPDAELPEVYVQPGESRLVTRADDAANPARLLRRHRVPGSAAGRGRALPSHAAAHAGKTGRVAEPFCRPPLCGLRHSRSGPAIRRAGREPQRGRGQAFRRRRRAGDGQHAPSGPRWAG